MNKQKRSNSYRLYRYIVRQKRLIFLGVLATLLMSLVELFTGSLLKFLTNLIGDFTSAYEKGFSEAVKLPVKYKIEIPLVKEKVAIINKNLSGTDEIFQGMVWLCILFVGLYFLESLFNYLRRVYMNAATQRILLNFKSDIYQKVLNLPYSFFNKNKTGDVVSRITYDVTTLSEIIDLFIEVARTIVYILVFVPFMFAMSWQLTLFTILFFPVSVILIEYVTRYIKKVSKEITDNVGDYTAFLEEKINRFKIIKGYCTEEKEGKAFDDLVESNYKFNLKLIKLKFSMNPTNDFLGMVALAIIYLLFSYKLTHSGANFGNIVFFLYLMRTLFKPVKKVAQAWGQLHIALVSTRKIFNLMDEAEEELSGSEKQKEVDTIHFEGVSFTYPGADKKIFDDVTLQAEKGDIIAVEGKSGVGKSTLMNLIPGFYFPGFGKILINNIDLKEYSLCSLRSSIGHVDSNTLFMNGTIQENIEYGSKRMTNEQSEEFTQFLGLKNIADLNLVIGKDGIDLSEGQKQKLSFLRAIITEPSVLILDEAFSSLDKEDIAFIMDKCKSVNIVFLVSRKKEVTRFANRKLTLKNGKCIVE